MESNGKAATPGTCLFAYGTLAEPEVVRALIGQVPLSHRARLADHAVYRMKEGVYPGVVREAGRTTPGRVYPFVDAPAMAIIEAFEDAVYERAEGEVMADDGRVWLARFYRVPDRARWVLSDEPWDAAKFRNDHLATYVAMCDRFRQARLSPGTSPGGD